MYRHFGKCFADILDMQIYILRFIQKNKDKFYYIILCSLYRSKNQYHANAFEMSNKI